MSLGRGLLQKSPSLLKRKKEKKKKSWRTNNTFSGGRRDGSSLIRTLIRDTINGF
jgi:hypothetical protein